MIIQRRILTARKAATCACGAAIAVGASYGHTYESGFVTKRCLPCHRREVDEDEHEAILDEMPDTAWGASDGGGLVP